MLRDVLNSCEKIVKMADSEMLPIEKHNFPG